MILLLLACEPPPPEADSLFAASVLAMGGEEAIRRHHTEIISGALSFPGQGVVAPMVEYLRAPNDQWTVMEYPGIGRFESGVLEGVVWAVDPVAGPRLTEGAERLQSVRSANFYAAADWKIQFPYRKTLGLRKEGDRERYEVLTRTEDGKEVHHFFDRLTHLETGLSSTVITETGPQPAQTRFSHWLFSDGVLNAMKTEDQTGPSSTVFLIESIVYDAPDFPSLALPPEVQALLAKKP